MKTRHIETLTTTGGVVAIWQDIRAGRYFVTGIPDLTGKRYITLRTARRMALSALRQERPA